MAYKNRKSDGDNDRKVVVEYLTSSSGKLEQYGIIPRRRFLGGGF